MGPFVGMLTDLPSSEIWFSPKERRTALISAVVTGKIDVRGAAPAAAEAA